MGRQALPFIRAYHFARSKKPAPNSSLKILPSRVSVALHHSPHHRPTSVVRLPPPVRPSFARLVHDPRVCLPHFTTPPYRPTSSSHRSDRRSNSSLKILHRCRALHHSPLPMRCWPVPSFPMIAAASFTPCLVASQLSTEASTLHVLSVTTSHHAPRTHSRLDQLGLILGCHFPASKLWSLTRVRSSHGVADSSGNCASLARLHVWEIA